MTTIENGTIKLTHQDNTVTVEVICGNAAEAKALFFTLMRTIRKDKCLELTFAGLSDERYQGERLQ